MLSIDKIKKGARIALCAMLMALMCGCGVRYSYISQRTPVMEREVPVITDYQDIANTERVNETVRIDGGVMENLWGMNASEEYYISGGGERGTLRQDAYSWILWFMDEQGAYNYINIGFPKSTELPPLRDGDVVSIIAKIPSDAGSRMDIEDLVVTGNTSLAPIHESYMESAAAMNYSDALRNPLETQNCVWAEGVIVDIDTYEHDFQELKVYCLNTNQGPVRLYTTKQDRTRFLIGDYVRAYGWTKGVYTNDSNKNGVPEFFINIIQLDPERSQNETMAEDATYGKQEGGAR